MSENLGIGRRKVLSLFALGMIIYVISACFAVTSILSENIIGSYVFSNFLFIDILLVIPIVIPLYIPCGLLIKQSQKLRLWREVRGDLFASAIILEVTYIIKIVSGMLLLYGLLINAVFWPDVAQTYLITGKIPEPSIQTQINVLSILIPILSILFTYSIRTALGFPLILGKPAFDDKTEVKTYALFLERSMQNGSMNTMLALFRRLLLIFEKYFHDWEGFQASYLKLATQMVSAEEKLLDGKDYKVFEEYADILAKAIKNEQYSDALKAIHDMTENTKLKHLKKLELTSAISRRMISTVIAAFVTLLGLFLTALPESTKEVFLLFILANIHFLPSSLLFILMGVFTYRSISRTLDIMPFTTLWDFFFLSELKRMRMHETKP